MSVPKGKRKESRFEAQHHFFRLRDEVTMLIVNDFGFSSEKYLKQIERYKETHPDGEEAVKRWMRKRESFDRWFIDKEGDVVLEMLRQIETNFTRANSIYPSETPAKEAEYIERRILMDAAISYCFALKQEIQYIIRTLPVDLNKYKRFAEMIDRQIALYKGVRQKDNRFIKGSL